VVGLDNYGFRGGFSGPRARLLAGRERRGSRRGRKGASGLLSHRSWRM